MGLFKKQLRYADGKLKLRRRVTTTRHAIELYMSTDNEATKDFAVRFIESKGGLI